MRPNSCFHGPWTSHACYVAAGDVIVSSGADRVIRSWTAAGAQLHEFSATGYTGCAGTLATSLVAAFNGSPSDITLWDAATGTVERKLAGHPTSHPRHDPGSNVLCAAFSPDGAWLASGGFDDHLRVWDVRTGAAGPSADLGAIVWSVGFSGDGALIAAGLFPRQVLVLDATTGQRRAMGVASKKAVTSVAFTPAGELVTGGGAGELVRWRIEGRELVEALTYVKPDGGGIEGLAISADGKHLAAASRGGWARVWDLASGKEHRRLAREDMLGLDVDFSPDGRRLVVAGPPALAFISIPVR